MAISKMFKGIYEENSIEYVFNDKAFKKAVIEKKSNSRKTGENLTQDRILEEIADKTSKTPDAVKRWLNGYNGPGDISLVKDIADYFGIDYHDLLSVKQEFNFTIERGDEKSIITHFYKLLSDFIYTYVGGHKMSSEKIEEIVSGDADLDDEVDAYIFDLYKLLDNVALEISSETYSKLHRYFAECRAISRIGDKAITQCFSDWPIYNTRWNAANPRLYVAALIAEQCFHDKFEEQQQLYDGYIEETGFESFIKSHNYSNDQASYVIEQLLPSDYEILVMEFARTLTLLFQSDFPQYFK